jgi:hypothetical protein
MTFYMERDFFSFGREMTSSLQSLPDLREIPSMPSAAYPAYLSAQAQTEDNKGLASYFEKSVLHGYAQSHPYDPIYLGKDLAVDNLAKQNNYMKLIFGGENSEYDNIDLAYEKTFRQMAESTVEKDSTLSEQNPLKFVPWKECGKDEILKTFEEQRRLYNGFLPSDAEVALKSRVTHNMTSFTFYNKKLSSNGQSLRYNNVRGQNELVLDDASTFFPQENLSSRTNAPDGRGGSIPLNYKNVYDYDARVVNVANETPLPADNPVQDAGLYHGREVDRYTFSENPVPSFNDLFYQYKERN